MKKCPYCAEEIQDKAIICRYCGKELVPPAVKFQEQPKPKMSACLITILILVGIFVVVFLFQSVVSFFLPSQTSSANTSHATSSATEKISATAYPTATEKPSIPPKKYTGSGDEFITLDQSFGPAILDITYSGDHNFTVKNFDKGNNYIDLLVNTIGSYSGKVAMDFFDGEDTKFIEVGSSGPWTITVSQLSENSLSYLTSSNSFSGRGDDVIFIGLDYLQGHFVCQGDGNFIVWSFGNDSDLLINEIAPYSGTVRIPSGMFILTVNSESNWSAEFE